MTEGVFKWLLAVYTLIASARTKGRSQWHGGRTCCETEGKTLSLWKNWYCVYR